MKCCMCDQPATVIDTEYDEAYCEKDARVYRVREDGPYRDLKVADEHEG